MPKIAFFGIITITKNYLTFKKFAVMIKFILNSRTKRIKLVIVSLLFCSMKTFIILPIPTRLFGIVIRYIIRCFSRGASREVLLARCFSRGASREVLLARCFSLYALC